MGIPRIEVVRDPEITPEEFLTKPRNPVRALLDNIRSAFNVGSIFRTSDAALVERLYLCGITAYPPNQKLDKTALGSIPYVPWEHYENAIDAVRAARADGYTIVSLEPSPASVDYFRFRFPERSCIVVGHEIAGVSKEVISASDAVVRIPMSGYKNTINVATAFGIVLFEVLRQHRPGAGTSTGN